MANSPAAGLDPRRPPSLRAGDRIGIFLPSSPIREPYRTRGLQALRDMGYVPVEVPEIFSSEGFVAKPPERVVEELRAFFCDTGIQALWAARGGYGANMVCRYLDRLEISTPKIVIGSSDVSILLWNLLEKQNMVVFYGPMAYADLADGTVNLEQLQGVLTGERPTPEFVARALIPGRAAGRMSGGCLTNLVSLVGTRYFPPLRDRILLLEDVGERPYRLHRMFWQLMESGVLAEVRGVVLGEFPGCFNHSGEREDFLNQVSEILLPLGVPVATGLPLGHAAVVEIVPLGVHAEIACEETACLKIRESGTVSPGPAW